MRDEIEARLKACEKALNEAPKWTTGGELAHAKFHAHAPTDLRWLLDELAAATKREQRLREATLRCLRLIDGYAGEGVQIQGLEDPADVFAPTCDALGMTQEEIDAFGDETARRVYPDREWRRHHERLMAQETSDAR